MLQTKNHQIGTEFSPYLIAEIGLNHDGNLDQALRMLDGVAESGAACAKFQLFSSEFFIDGKARLGEQEPGSLRGFFKQFELKEVEWLRVAEHTRSLGLDFACSVFDAPSLKFYRELKPSFIKIASCDVTNRILLEDAREFGLPVFLSTGTADAQEVDQAMQWLKGKKDILLFQCVSAYPARPQDYNLRVLPDWISRYKVPVGLSDHCLTNALSSAAVAMGARAIEKHFTLDKNLSGPDHKLSLELAEFRLLVEDCQAVFESLGTGKKLCTTMEQPAREGGRRSLFAGRSIAADSPLAREDFLPLRPGGGVGVEHYDEKVGQVLERSLESGQPFEESDFT